MMLPQDRERLRWQEEHNRRCEQLLKKIRQMQADIRQEEIATNFRVQSVLSKVDALNREHKLLQTQLDRLLLHRKQKSLKQRVRSRLHGGATSAFSVAGLDTSFMADYNTTLLTSVPSTSLDYKFDYPGLSATGYSSLKLPRSNEKQLRFGGLTESQDFTGTYPIGRPYSEETPHMLDADSSVKRRLFTVPVIEDTSIARGSETTGTADYNSVYSNYKQTEGGSLQYYRGEYNTNSDLNGPMNSHVLGTQSSIGNIETNLSGVTHLQSTESHNNSSATSEADASETHLQIPNTSSLFPVATSTPSKPNTVQIRQSQVVNKTKDVVEPEDTTDKAIISPTPNSVEQKTSKNIITKNDISKSPPTQQESSASVNKKQQNQNKSISSEAEKKSPLNKNVKFSETKPNKIIEDKKPMEIVEHDKTRSEDKEEEAKEETSSSEASKEVYELREGSSDEDIYSNVHGKGSKIWKDDNQKNSKPAHMDLYFKQLASEEESSGDDSLEEALRAKIQSNPPNNNTSQPTRNKQETKSAEADTQENGTVNIGKISQNKTISGKNEEEIKVTTESNFIPGIKRAAVPLKEDQAPSLNNWSGSDARTGTLFAGKKSAATFNINSDDDEEEEDEVSAPKEQDTDDDDSFYN